MLRVKVIVTPDFKQWIKSSKKDVEKGLKRGLKKAAQDIKRTAQLDLTTGVRTGIKHPGLGKRSSAPGEGLTGQSGELKNSIKKRSLKRGLVWRIGSKKIQAVWQFGFGRKSQARPWLSIAVKKVRFRIQRTIKREIERALR